MEGLSGPLLPQKPLEKAGAKPPTFSSGFAVGEPFRPPKSTISGPENLWRNLKYRTVLATASRVISNYRLAQLVSTYYPT